MRTSHTVHSLIVDLSFANATADAMAWAEWTKSSLLRVIDEVFDQHAAISESPQQRTTRIAKLELNLGTVFLHESETEIARRLHAQLSAALNDHWQEHSETGSEPATDMQAQNDFQNFLNSGTISWEKSGQSKFAHKKLLFDAFNRENLQANQTLLQEITDSPRQLKRLVQQYDTGELFHIVRHMLASWTNQPGEALLDWVSLELIRLRESSHIEFWTYLLPLLRYTNQDLNQIIQPWLKHNQTTVEVAAENYRRLLTARTGLSNTARLALSKVLDHYDTQVVSASHGSIADERPRIQERQLTPFIQDMDTPAISSLQPAMTGDALLGRSKIQLTETQLNKTQLVQAIYALQTANAILLAPNWRRLISQHSEIIKQLLPDYLDTWLDNFPIRYLQDMVLRFQTEASPAWTPQRYHDEQSKATVPMQRGYRLLLEAPEHSLSRQEFHQRISREALEHPADAAALLALAVPVLQDRSTEQIRTGLLNSNPHTLAEAMTYAIRYRPSLIIELRESCWRHWAKHLSSIQQSIALTMLHPALRSILQVINGLDPASFDSDTALRIHSFLWASRPGSVFAQQINAMIIAAHSSVETGPGPELAASFRFSSAGSLHGSIDRSGNQANAIMTDPAREIIAPVTTESVHDANQNQITDLSAEQVLRSLKSADPMQLNFIWERAVKQQTSLLLDCYRQLSARQRKILTQAFTVTQSLTLARLIHPGIAELLDELIQTAEFIAEFISTQTPISGYQRGSLSAQNIQKLVLTFSLQTSQRQLSAHSLIKRIARTILINDESIQAFCEQLINSQSARFVPVLSTTLTQHFLLRDARPHTSSGLIPAAHTDLTSVSTSVSTLVSVTNDQIALSDDTQIVALLKNADIVALNALWDTIIFSHTGTFIANFKQLDRQERSRLAQLLHQEHLTQLAQILQGSLTSLIAELIDQAPVIVDTLLALKAAHNSVRESITAAKLRQHVLDVCLCIEQERQVELKPAQFITQVLSKTINADIHTTLLAFDQPGWPDPSNASMFRAKLPLTATLFAELRRTGNAIPAFQDTRALTMYGNTSAVAAAPAIDNEPMLLTEHALNLLMLEETRYRVDIQAYFEGMDAVSTADAARLTSLFAGFIERITEMLAGQRPIRELPDLVKHNLAGLSHLSNAQLHQLLLAWTKIASGGNPAEVFLSTLERYALRARSPHHFLSTVLQALLNDQAVDFEQVLEAGNRSAMNPPILDRSANAFADFKPAPNVERTATPIDAMPPATNFSDSFSDSFSQLLASMLNRSGIDNRQAYLPGSATANDSAQVYAGQNNDDENEDGNPIWFDIRQSMGNRALQFWLCEWIATTISPYRPARQKAARQLTEFDPTSTSTALALILKALLTIAPKNSLSTCLDILQKRFDISSLLLAQLQSYSLSSVSHQQHYELCIRFFKELQWDSQSEKSAQESTKPSAPISINNIKISSLPDKLRNALPNALAEAMLTTRLDSLDLFWHEITSCHGELLAQAQLHYLTVAERRARIIKNNRPNKLADMLKVLSPTLAELVEELNRTWSSIRSILSPNRSFDEFELHTLSESFELIFKPQLRNASRTVQARTLLHVILGQEDPGTIFHGKMKQLFYQITPSLAPRWHEFLSLSLHLNTFNEFNDFDVARDLSPGDERGEPATAPITIDTALIDTNTAREILFSDLLEHDLHEVFTAFDSGESHWSLTSILGDTHACALRSHYLAELAPELSHGFWQSYADELAEMDERVRAAPAITPVGNQIARTLSFDTVENRYQRVFRQFIKSQATLAESPAKAEQASRRELVHDKPGSIRKNLQLTYCLFLLQRPAEPTPHEMIYGRHAFTSLLQLAPPLLTQLGTALQTSEAVDRLCQILENIDLTRLFEILAPGLAAHVHGLCEAIQNTAQETAQKTAQDTAQDTPAIKLYDKPGVLRAASWRALYRAEFSSPRPPTLRRFSLRLLEELSREFGSDLNKNSAQDASIVDAEASLQRIAIGQLQKNQEKKRQQMLSNQPEIKSTMSITASDKKPKQVNVDTATGFAGDSNIFNAGMVIVAPYIQRLFTILELCENGKFVDDLAAGRGVHLLQYIVTGEERTPEYLLSLNKLLCGIHGGVPIVAGIQISAHEKDVIEQMLLGVIGHWSAIGQTSIAGLRETFLVREGRLSFQEDAWQLKVVTSTFDMLLDRLPWSFAIIKFPWMVEALHVSWR